MSDDSIKTPHLKLLYDAKVEGKELKFKAMMEERHKAWLPFLEQAKLVSDDPAEQIRLADAAAVNELIVPPHWRKWVECSGCGYMPVFGSYSKDTPKVDTCPWCNAPGGRYKDDLPPVRYLGNAV